jgi:hypothetical protein
MRNWLYLLLFVPACGSGGGSELTIHSGRELAAGLEIDGAWQAIPPNADTTFSVNGPYSVTSVCAGYSAGSVDIHSSLRTPEDSDDFWLSCGRDSDVVPVTANVNVEPGIEVRIGSKRLDANEPFDTFSPGHWDVYAWSSAGYTIRRDVEIDEGTTIDLEVGSTWHGFESRDVTIDGEPAPADSIVAGLFLESGHETFVDLPASGTPLRVVSPIDLEEDDRQLVSTTKAVTDGYLGATIHVGDGPVALVLPPEIAEAHGSYEDVPTVTWRYDGVWTSASFSAAASNGNSLCVGASSSWIEATGTTDTLVGVDVRAMPGFDAAWFPSPVITGLDLHNTDPDGPDTSASKKVSSP